VGHPVALSSLVEVYNFASSVFEQLLSLGHVTIGLVVGFLLIVWGGQVFKFLFAAVKKINRLCLLQWTCTYNKKLKIPP